MRISILNVSLLAALAIALPMQTSFAETDPEVIALLKKMEARIAELESKDSTEAPSADDAAMARRIAELESRLEEQEQETKEVKVLASSSAVAGEGGSSILGNRATFDILAGSAWRNLRWTQEEQWVDIKVGITDEEVVDILGYPPRSVDSLKPRIDKVYWYETSIRDRSTGMRGRISFKKGKVVSFEKPDFDAVAAAKESNPVPAANTRRVP